MWCGGVRLCFFLLCPALLRSALATLNFKMALRNAATSALSALGLRAQVFGRAGALQATGAMAARTFATGELN